MVDGIKQRSIEGVSMSYSFAKGTPMRRPHSRPNILKCSGNRGISQEGWYANTIRSLRRGTSASTPPQDVVKGYKWELYDLTKDWTQNHDLSKEQPAKLKEMQKALHG